jgi:hypothetical protein
MLARYNMPAINAKLMVNEWCPVGKESFFPSFSKLDFLFISVSESFVMLVSSSLCRLFWQSSFSYFVPMMQN